MPQSNTFGVGGLRAALATATSRGLLIPADDLATNSRELQCEGLPFLYLWCNQSVGAVGATAQLQFMVRATGQNPEWLALTQPVVLPPAVPTLLYPGLKWPAAQIRLVITRPAGQATTVEYILGASA